MVITVTLMITGITTMVITTMAMIPSLIGVTTTVSFMIEMISIMVGLNIIEAINLIMAAKREATPKGIDT